MRRPTALAALVVTVSTLVAPATAAPTDPPASAERAAPSTRVVVEDLPRGAAPRVDVLVGRTLIHRGRAVVVRLPGGGRPELALGTWAGKPIVGGSAAGGVRFFTVAPDGRATPLGTRAFDFYNQLPQLVRATGHLVLGLFDRGGADPVYTVVDAATGAELLRTTDVDALAPADRRVVLRWTANPSKNVSARSRDGRVELAVRNAYYSSPTRLIIRRTGDHRALARFRFPWFAASEVNGDTVGVVASQAVFENRRSFLVLGVVRPGTATTQPRYAVVRCTVAGVCERATSTARSISVAGADALNFTSDQ